MRRLSHLDKNAENDVEEFRWEQGRPLWDGFCRMSDCLLFGGSSPQKCSVLVSLSHNKDSHAIIRFTGILVYRSE